MSCDFFVYWNNDKPKPTDKQIKWMLEDYLGGVGKITWKRGVEGHKWFFISLPGNVSKPVRRVVEKEYEWFGRITELDAKERWFEVCLSDDAADVITRMADEFTQDIAYGFAKLLARFWQGRLEA